MKNKTFDIAKMLRPSIAKLQAYSSARDEFQDAGSEHTFLDANENPFENGLNRYPDPNQIAVKNRLSEIKGIQSENILLGNGSDEVLDLIFRAFCEPNKDNIIINPPTYGMYKVLAALNNVAIKNVPLTNDFQLQTNRIIASVDKNTKIVFVCSPNNPTGNLMQISAIKKLLEQDILVVIDEAYIDFTEEKSWLQEVKNYNNLIVTQTLSKAYGLAGIRLGICYSNSVIINILQKIKMPYNVNVLTQSTALKSLENNATVEKEIQRILKNREALIVSLKKISFIETIYPSDANFLLVKVDDANLRYQQLIENDVVVRNRTNEPLCNNCLRITVGTAQENEKLIKNLVQLDN